MEKTLGGDRLGSGKKMKVHLHGYERSTHDLGYLWRSTMSSGTLVPFMCEIALPGDTFDIDLDCDIKTHPTIGPLFGSYKVQLDVFQAPIRLYHSALHNNALNIGRNISLVKLPIITMVADENLDPNTTEDIDNSQINPSSLPAYLGIRGIGIMQTAGSISRSFCAIPILAYWEIYKNYYANKQEEIGAVIHTPSSASVQTIDSIEIDTNILPQQPGTSVIPLTEGSFITINYTGASPLPSQILISITPGGRRSVEELFTNIIDDPGTTTISGQFNFAAWGDLTSLRWDYQSNQDLGTTVPEVATFPLTNIDNMRVDILSSGIGLTYDIATLDQEPYKWLYERPNDRAYILSTQEGLGLKTYLSDLFNNWLSTEWIDGAGGISEITSIDTSGGSFSIDTLILSRKVYNMLNRIAVSGGSYDDWMDAVYAHDRYQRCESPMYMGGLIKELVFQEVISNSSETGPDGSQPLGTLAGRGILGKKHKGGHVVIKIDEPSYIMGIVSLTPRIDYSQGNKWHVHLKTMDDLHKPALDEIGFQELITEQLAWWDTKYDPGTTSWIQRSAGKQPAWINYMTNVNRTYGNFAIPENEMFMTLNRRYEFLDTGAGTGDIKDLTTYIDPSKFNFIFANTAIDAQNFWAQIAVDITARRKMSAKLMPNL